MPSAAAKAKWASQVLDLPGYPDPDTGKPNVRNPAAPTSLVATPGTGSASIAFTAGDPGSSAITNYEYKVGSGAWTALSPAATASPVTIPSLAAGVQVNIRLRAVNAGGAGAQSAPVSVTPN